MRSTFSSLRADFCASNASRLSDIDLGQDDIANYVDEFSPELLALLDGTTPKAQNPAIQKEREAAEKQDAEGKSLDGGPYSANPPELLAGFDSLTPTTLQMSGKLSVEERAAKKLQAKDCHLFEWVVERVPSITSFFDCPTLLLSLRPLRRLLKHRVDQELNKRFEICLSALQANPINKLLERTKEREEWILPDQREGEELDLNYNQRHESNLSLEADNGIGERWIDVDLQLGWSQEFSNESILLRETLKGADLDAINDVINNLEDANIDLVDLGKVERELRRKGSVSDEDFLPEDLPWGVGLVAGWTLSFNHMLRSDRSQMLRMVIKNVFGYKGDYQQYVGIYNHEKEALRLLENARLLMLYAKPDSLRYSSTECNITHEDYPSGEERAAIMFCLRNGNRKAEIRLRTGYMVR